MLEISMALVGLRIMVFVLVAAVAFGLWKWFMAVLRLRYASRTLMASLGKMSPNDPAYEKMYNLCALLNNTSKGMIDGEFLSEKNLDEVLVISKRKAKAAGERNKADAKLIKRLAKREVKSRMRIKHR
jgi:hypothetical protein